MSYEGTPDKDKSASPRQPGQREHRRPPLRARLQRCVLTKTELTLLEAMVEHSWAKDGQDVFASYDRLGAWAKCCTRTVRRLIEGYTDTRNGLHHDGLLERGILIRKDGHYYLNEAALPIDPRVKSYLDRSRQRRPAKQMELPGIAQATPPKVDTVSANTGHGVPQTVDTVSLEPKAIGEPKAFEPGLVLQHAIDYARALVEQVQLAPYELVSTKQLLEAIAGSLKALLKGGKSLSEAYDFLLVVTLDAIERGKLINPFFYTDAKWRQSHGPRFNAVSASAARVGRHLESSIDAVRGYRTERARDNSRVREN